MPENLLPLIQPAVAGRAVLADGLVSSRFSSGLVGHQCHAAGFHLDHSHGPLDYTQLHGIDILGGFSQGMGDAAIGIGLLHWLGQQYPVERVVWLTPGMPHYVVEMYALALACGALERIESLPVEPGRLMEAGRVSLDLTDLFGAGFRAGPIADLYARALGLDPAVVPREAKQCQWLAAVPISPPAGDYVLLVADSKEAFKSVPADLRPALIDGLARYFGLPVKGFGEVPGLGPIYQNLQAEAPDARAFIGWIAGAQRVFSVDTAAAHIAAGLQRHTTVLSATRWADTWYHYYPGLHHIRTVETGWAPALAQLFADG